MHTANLEFKSMFICAICGKKNMVDTIDVLVRPRYKRGR